VIVLVIIIMPCVYTVNLCFDSCTVVYKQHLPIIFHDKLFCFDRCGIDQSLFIVTLLAIYHLYPSSCTCKSSFWKSLFLWKVLDYLNRLLVHFFYELQLECKSYAPYCNYLPIEINLLALHTYISITQKFVCTTLFRNKCLILIKNKAT